MVDHGRQIEIAVQAASGLPRRRLAATIRRRSQVRCRRGAAYAPGLVLEGGCRSRNSQVSSCRGSSISMSRQASCDGVHRVVAIGISLRELWCVDSGPRVRGWLSRTVARLPVRPRQNKNSWLSSVRRGWP